MRMILIIKYFEQWNKTKAGKGPVERMPVCSLRWGFREALRVEV